VGTLRDRILELVRAEPGCTDREVTDRLLGRGAPQQATNQQCRLLEVLVRRKRSDGLIANYPASVGPGPVPQASRLSGDNGGLGEDAIKRVLDRWLRDQGWETEISWGRRSHGVDIRATLAGRRWLIEVKGEGAHAQARANYFLGVLGELLQGMSDPDAAYSVALPDLPQFRALWDRLPAVAKARTGITALFVRNGGTVFEDR
jgi:hypothetical protein